MGGIGCGDWYRGRKSYLDDCRRLCINRMAKLKAISPNGRTSGSWVWTDVETGEKTSSIGYESCTTDPENMYLRLHYTFTETGEKVDYKIKLVTTCPNYGGKRFWFICPYNGKRVAKLSLPYGAIYFASRHAYGLKYASQSETVQGRAINRMWKYKNKLGGDFFPIRPKGMHERTFERLLAAADKADEIASGLLFLKLEKYSFNPKKNFS